MVGSGLEFEDNVIQMSVFSSGNGNGSRPRKQGAAGFCEEGKPYEAIVWLFPAQIKVWGAGMYQRGGSHPFHECIFQQEEGK